MKRLFPVIVIIICLLPQLFVSCANSSRAPQGGVKDTIPPMLLGRIPEYKAVNFKGKQISFAFNEYIQLKEQNKQFTMSPPIEKKPILKVKGKQVVVSFTSDLQPNTTYFIGFGKSIVDLNEGNAIEYLSTVFSTGDGIDSMVYAGRLVDAFEFKPVEGAFVFLYHDDIDSIPYLKNPNALSRTDKDGIFLIKGLKPINYKVVAVEDKNLNYKYDAGSEQIAFLDTLIHPLQISENDSISYDKLPVIRMFAENVRKQYLSSYKQPEQRQIELIFNQINPEIITFDVDKLTKNDFIIERSRWSDTLKYWITAKALPDSMRAVINYMKTDSLNQLTATEAKLKFELEKKDVPKPPAGKKGEKEQIPTLSPNIKAVAEIVVESNVRIDFNAPLVNVDTALITLLKYNDVGDKKEPIKFSWIQDTLRIRNYTLKAAWEISSKYELQIQPKAFTDIYGISNDSIKKVIETANPDKYSSLEVEITNAKGNYIVQLMNGKSVIAQKITNKNGVVRFDYLNPSKYRVRIIDDKNGNNIWDSGFYLQKLQPEQVAFIKFTDSADANELDLRPNWTIKQKVDIGQIFTNK